jgi:excisionase family DNA binding protein
MMTQYLPLDALAARLNLSARYLRQLADAKKIPSLDVNGRRRFDEQDVRDALKRLAGESRGRRTVLDGGTYAS